MATFARIRFALAATAVRAAVRALVVVAAIVAAAAAT